MSWHTVKACSRNNLGKHSDEMPNPCQKKDLQSVREIYQLTKIKTYRDLIESGRSLMIISEGTSWTVVTKRQRKLTLLQRNKLKEVDYAVWWYLNRARREVEKSALLNLKRLGQRTRILHYIYLKYVFQVKTGKYAFVKGLFHVMQFVQTNVFP